MGDVKGTKNQYRFSILWPQNKPLCWNTRMWCHLRLHSQVTFTGSLFIYVTQTICLRTVTLPLLFHNISMNQSYVPWTRVTTSHAKRYPSFPPFLVSYYQ